MGLRTESASQSHILSPHHNSHSAMARLLLACLVLAVVALAADAFMFGGYGGFGHFTTTVSHHRSHFPGFGIGIVRHASVRRHWLRLPHVRRLRLRRLRPRPRLLLSLWRRPEVSHTSQ